GLMVPIVSLVAIILLWGQWMTPTASRSRLRKHYPAVAAAIRRCRQPGDVDEKYTPALVIDGKRFFLIYYHGKKAPDDIRGILLLDEKGHRVSDDGLLRRAAKCKTLALETVSYDRHQARAGQVASFARAVTTLERVSRYLREQRPWFVAAGEGLEEDLDQVLRAVPVAQAFVDAAARQTLIRAEWAATHGLGRLTEVSYGEVSALEERINEALSEARSNLRPLEEAVEPARKLADSIRGRPGLARRRSVLELLQGLIDLGEGIQADPAKGYVYGYLDEGHWAAWRERMAYADEVDAKEKVAEQR
ncbi:MAG: hypothetical protein AB1449_15515, partial [Chloroflexota bacterium]